MKISVTQVAGRALLLAVFSLLTVLSAAANTITVDELSVNPYKTPTISCDGLGTVTVYAGVLKLRVDGVEMDGFCIDPWHFSVSSSPDYQYAPLTSAPKEHSMSSETALLIERLWGRYYSPTINASDAAGLQIAIWRLVAGEGFSLISADDFGAATFLASVQGAGYTGPVANLVGLTGPGQDYAVQGSLPGDPTHGVPDSGATAGLLSLGLAALVFLRRSWLAR